MSARANPYHNAWTECCRAPRARLSGSFAGCLAPLGSWATLKAEMLQNGRFINATDTRAELFAFSDGYDETQRLHSFLNYRPPGHFEADLAVAS